MKQEGLFKVGCFLCGSEEFLEVHHIDFHHNNNRPENRIKLCRRHHVLLHKSGFFSLDELLRLNKRR